MDKDKSVRPSVGDGIIYPKDNGELESLIQAQIEVADISIYLKNKRIKGLILPSISYDYSSDLLAQVYVNLLGRSFDEIFIFADPVMHELDYLAFNSNRYWETPLSKVETSHRLNQIVRSDDDLRDLMKIDDSKHSGEVSIETQLPFLDVVLEHQFKLIPFMHGKVSPRLAVSMIEPFVDQDDLVIAVTSLSSGLPENYTEEVDTPTIDAILNLDIDYLESTSLEASSPYSLATICTLAKHRGWKVEKIAYQVAHLTNANRTTHIGMAGFVLYD